MKKWFPKAAFIYVDMERGLYQWPGKAPTHKDGRPRVVKKQILIDCGLQPTYPRQTTEVWGSPDFNRLLDEERARRDHGVVDLIEKVEEVTGPLIDFRTTMQENVISVFERRPDSEDPEALSPDQYQKGALAWSKYIDELTGRTNSQQEQGIQAIVTQMYADRQVTSGMVSVIPELMRKFMEHQDREMRRAGMLVDE